MNDASCPLESRVEICLCETVCLCEIDCLYEICLCEIVCVKLFVCVKFVCVKLKFAPKSDKPNVSKFYLNDFRGHARRGFGIGESAFLLVNPAFSARRKWVFKEIVFFGATSAPRKELAFF